MDDSQHPASHALTTPPDLRPMLHLDGGCFAHFDFSLIPVPSLS